MNKETDFFPVDVYSFLGHEVGIRSNSSDVLCYLQQLFQRFYLGHDGSSVDTDRQGDKKQRLVTQIIERMASSGEILVEDTINACRLRCQDLTSFSGAPNWLGWTTPSPRAVIQGIVLRNVSLLATEYLFFHAGAVSLENEGVLFPASSGLGKTTLTLKLVIKGFGFLADDAACLDPVNGILVPFPKKLNLSDHSCKLVGMAPQPNAAFPSPEYGKREQTIDIEELVPASISDPCPLRYIVFLQGFGERVRLERVARSRALFQLLNASLNPVEKPGRLLFDLAPLVDSVGCFNLVVGDLDETAETVERILTDRTGDEK